jgi:hypothetical protein
MIREAIASVLLALADRITPDVPIQVEAEIRYVYIYSTPPATVTPWQQWPTSPTITCSTSTQGRLPEVKSTLGFGI